MKPELLLVSPIPPRVIDALKDDFVLHDYFRAKDKPSMLKEVGGKVRGYISFASAGGADASLMDATPKLELIANWGVGYDRVDAKAAKQRNIVVTNTPDVLTECCADLAMALILAIARRVAEGDRYVRAGNWPKLGSLALATRVSGGRLGIVGLGRIGAAIAQRALAFAMEVSYSGPRQKPDVPYRYFADPKALAAHVDFLILACPGGPDTAGLVDAALLHALGREGMLINIARASVVDEAALIEALANGTIKAAALDVFPDEPNVSDALLALPNVIVEPHIASTTVETRKAIGELVFANVKSYFSGAGPLTPLV